MTVSDEDCRKVAPCFYCKGIGVVTGAGCQTNGPTIGACPECQGRKLPRGVSQDLNRKALATLIRREKAEAYSAGRIAGIFECANKGPQAPNPYAKEPT